MYVKPEPTYKFTVHIPCYQHVPIKNCNKFLYLTSIENIYDYDLAVIYSILWQS